MDGFDGSDYGTRTLFSERESWSTMDPLAEKNYSISRMHIVVETLSIE
jgi:hypothetical protein